MAILGAPNVPYTGEITGSADTLRSAGVYNLGTGQSTLGGAVPQQQSLAALLAGLGGGTFATGTTGATDIASLLGLESAATLPQAQDLFKSGVATETSGMLPESAQGLLKQRLSDTTNAIKSKYASLGMSGSTAELDEIAKATNDSTSMQFQLATQLGGAETSQAATLLNLGFSGLSTAGNIGTTLAQLGISGLSLSSNDIANIANEALNQMQIGQAGVIGGANIFQQISTSQLAQDNRLTDMIGKFFQALASNAGNAASAGAGK